MDERTPEEKRQAVVFAARFRYSQQNFHIKGTDELWTGDPFNLPQGVEPNMPERGRWEIWRNACPPEWTDAQVDAYQFKHWCGAFALVCLHDAQLALDVHWRDGLGFCEPHHLPHTKTPQPGDIAWFLKNQHYAVVEAVRGNVFDSIDGNQGATMQHPSIKPHVGRELSSVAVFYSIEPFLP